MGPVGDFLDQCIQCSLLFVGFQTKLRIDFYPPWKVRVCQFAHENTKRFSWILTNLYTPRKINGWNLKMTQLQRKIIWTKPSCSGSMLIFQGVTIYNLVGGFNPFEKYESNWESFPQIRDKHKNYFSCHHPDNIKITYSFGFYIKKLPHF